MRPVSFKDTQKIVSNAVCLNFRILNKQPEGNERHGKLVFCHDMSDAQRQQ
jgi:hypothetical protein